MGHDYSVDGSGRKFGAELRGEDNSHAGHFAMIEAAPAVSDQTQAFATHIGILNGVWQSAISAML